MTPVSEVWQSIIALTAAVTEEELKAYLQRKLLQWTADAPARPGQAAAAPDPQGAAEAGDAGAAPAVGAARKPPDMS